jgi:hypothetical protein
LKIFAKRTQTFANACANGNCSDINAPWFKNRLAGTLARPNWATILFCAYLSLFFNGVRNMPHPTGLDLCVIHAATNISRLRRCGICANAPTRTALGSEAAAQAPAIRRLRISLDRQILRALLQVADPCAVKSPLTAGLITRPGLGSVPAVGAWVDGWFTCFQPPARPPQCSFYFT